MRVSTVKLLLAHRQFSVSQVCQLLTLPFSYHVFPLRRNGSSFHAIAILKNEIGKVLTESRCR
jgi:hypothetical protein